jgi:AraC-like DNA-binding protein
VVLDDLDVELETSGRAAVIVISEEQALPVGAAGRVFAYEWLLRMIHGLAAWLVAHPLPLDEVSFPYPPPLHAADYELVFAPRYTFDAPRLEARFPAEWLALPVRRDEAALRVFLVDAPASITTLYRRDRALSLRVREHLRAALPEHRACRRIARRLFLSPRTLHRRLEDEGTSFRAIKDGLRRELATEWLTKTTTATGPHRRRPRLRRRRRLLPRLHRLDRQRPARLPEAPRASRCGARASRLNRRRTCRPLPAKARARRPKELPCAVVI